MEPGDTLSNYDDQVYEAMDLPQKEWRTAIYSVVDGLKAIWAVKPTPEVAYAIGYCLAHLPTLGAEEFVSAKEWLERALDRAPEDMYARYYLVMLFFHHECYFEAKQRSRDIPPRWFAEHGQEWRDHKLAEVGLACEIALDPTAVASEKLSDVLRIHHDAPEREVWPLPEEVVSTLCKLLAGARAAGALKRKALSELSCAVVAELNACGLSEVFAAEIESIKRELAG